MEEAPLPFPQEKQPLPIEPAKKSYVYPTLIIGIIILIICVCIGFYITRDKNTSSISMQPTSTTTSPTQSPVWKSHTIPAAHLTFSAPSELQVVSEIQNGEDGKVESVTLYVQKGTAGQADYYQLYGLYRFQGDFTRNSLEELKSELDPAMTEDRQVANFPAVEGQILGERNRYAIYILTNRGMLSLFTAEPTEENIQVTHEILNTFTFTD